MIRSLLPVTAALLLASCGPEKTTSTTSSTALPADKQTENAVVHTTTAADAAYVAGTDPIRESGATLFVNGMGCPQCVTSIDLMLEKQVYTDKVRVDLGSGIVYTTFNAKKHPTPAQLAKLVKDAGFTLVKITPGAPEM